MRLSDLTLDGEDVYWSERRPAEGGRLVVVCRRAGHAIEDVTPPGFNARTRVHEYGGAAYVADQGTVWFSNFDDQRVYRQDPGREPVAITRRVDRRYADAIVDRRRGRLIAVREDHADPSQEPINNLVALGVDGDGESVLASGADFYSNPRLSPDGGRLCWLQWNHPHLPWDGTELWYGELDVAGGITGAHRVPATDDDAIYQPEWSPQGVLHFVSDRSGWWNLYRLIDGRAEAVAPAEAEFGIPQWVFRESMYGFTADGDMIAAYFVKGTGRLARVAGGRVYDLTDCYEECSWLGVARDHVYCIAGSPTEAPAVVELPLTGGEPVVLRRSVSVDVDPACCSPPETVEFATEAGRTAYGFYYRPHNPDFQAPADALPPLLVHVHGGPTGATTTTLNLETQFWTTRGFAVIDVNYGGSTGYGTEYRRRLNGQWGVVDLDDTVNAARHLVREGRVDSGRLAIAGASAGGYTTLACLTMRPGEFAAGADYFGLSDLRVFVHDTHKFESRYLDSLVGPWPERKDLYIARSPITHVDALATPLIVLQGDEDKIVPPNQSEIIVDAARRKRLPVAYLLFEGEQHGFRKGENIKRSLEAELYFYSRVFNFVPADEIDPVPIENL
jgi:dipeptidyl aminopeptidase/acylaminoacyl peptidase